MASTSVANFINVNRLGKVDSIC